MGEVNANVDTDEVPVGCPNTVGVLLVALAVCDAAKENKGDVDDELADEPMTGDLLVCQLELKMPEVGPLLEIAVFEKELVVLRVVVPEPNGFAGGTDEPITDTLVVNDVPNIIDESDDPNRKGTLCVTVDAPFVGSNCEPTADELPNPERDI